MDCHDNNMKHLSSSRIKKQNVAIAGICGFCNKKKLSILIVSGRMCDFCDKRDEVLQLYQGKQGSFITWNGFGLDWN